MKICLTGGNGRLATAFIRLAISCPDIRLRVLGHPQGCAPSPNIEWLDGDLSDAATCEHLVGDQDVLVHLAWRGAPLSNSGFAEGLVAGLLPSAQLLDAVARHGRLRVVYASSGGTVYEEGAKHRPHREEDPCLPKNPYGIMKLSVEHLLRILCLAGNCCATVLRISTAYGWPALPNAQQGFISIAIAAALGGKPIRLVGDPKNVRDFVHRDDVARALLIASQQEFVSGDFQIINIGSGVGTSVTDVIALIESLMSRKLATIQECSKEARGLPGYSVLDITRAREVLGWSPEIDLIAGIKRGLREERPRVR